MSASVSTAAPLNRGMITISVMLATVMQVVDTTIVNVALAARAGQHVGHAGSDLVGADVVHRRRGDLHSAHGRARRPLRAQALVRRGRHRLHARLDVVRRGDVADAARRCSALCKARSARASCRCRKPCCSTPIRARSTAPRWRCGAWASWSARSLGPTLGGYLTEYYSWRWAFYINLPVGMLALIGVIGFVPEGRERAEKRGFDFFGFALLSIAIGALQLMLDRGNALDWFDSTEVVLEAATAALALYLFLVAHVHGRQAVHRARLVRRPQFRGRRHADVHGRRAAARDDGAAATVPPKLARLPRDHGRLRARAARRRHDGRDDGRRPARRQSRHAPAGAHRARADGVVVARDDAVQHRRRRRGDRLHGHRPGNRARLHLRATVGDRVRDAGSALPQRRHGDVQPDPQLRQQRRYLARHDRARPRSAVRATRRSARASPRSATPSRRPAFRRSGACPRSSAASPSTPKCRGRR